MDQQSSLTASEEKALNPLNTEHLMTDLRSRSVRGGLVTITSQVSQFFISSVSTVVLARLLTPADFGLVAMVSTITGLGQAFADLGLSEATIQRKDITHDQVSGLFWINAAIGLALMLITGALGPALAKFYREPRLIDITLWMSLTFLLGGLRVQADAVLKRQMRFSALAIRDITASTLGVAVAITIAAFGYGYWALVALPLTLNSIVMVLSWLMVNWRPSLRPSGAGLRPLVSFGGNVAASYFMINIDRSADNVLVGWHLGAGPLGLYSRAYNLLMLPVRQLSAPAGSVAVPAFSRILGDPERFARYYLRAVNLLAWIGGPIFGFLFVAAQPVILLSLGRQWQEAAPVFQILVISALAQLLLESTVWLFVSRGQSGLFLRVLLIMSPIIIASFAMGLPFGIRGVALSGSVVLLGVLPWMLKLAFRGTLLTLGRLSRALLCPIAVSLISGFSAELVLHFTGVQHIIPQLMIVALSFALATLLSTLVPAVKDEISSIRTLIADLRGISPAVSAVV